MKIYTKTGDKGTTGLYGGKRVSKDSPRITAYGEIDELNAVIGIIRAETTHQALKESLAEIQNVLFICGAELATPLPDPKIPVVTSAHSEVLERQIDAISENLQPMKHFILPGGSKTAAYMHLARTVCMRAERSVVRLGTLPGENVSQWVVIYLNRLSDYLFTTARLANQLENIADIPWLGGK